MTARAQRVARSTLVGAAFAGLAALGLGCATPPKPPELEAFERLRAEPSATAAAKRSPDLVKGADTWLGRSREQWQDNDLEEARHSALMGHIKLKHAIALLDQETAKARIANAEVENKESAQELADLKKDLQAMRDHIGLLKKLHEQQAQLTAAEQRALTEQKALAEQLEKERQKAAAAERVADAELAIKAADTVSAAKHAKVPYGAAMDMLARAQQELGHGSFAAAQTSADMAKKKATEAAEAAKPLYDQEAQSAENRARAEALARDAAAIPGIVLRREARGSLQRLVLPLQADGLFKSREVTLSPGRDAALEPIAELIKKYPNYPVQVVGYTDTRGRTNELLALSLARAQAVYSALVFRGVDAKRMVVSGLGGSEPISDNRTVAGRARNNRIEVVFLYQ